MKTLLSMLSILFLINCSSNAQNSTLKKTYKIEKNNAEWRKQLTAIQYYVLREAGTEMNNSSI